MKNANFCHFWAIFCPFLPIFAFFAIFSCLNTVLHVFAKFYGLLIIISQFLMGCAKMHTPPRNRVISDAPRNRVNIALKIIYQKCQRKMFMLSIIFFVIKIGQKSQKSDSNPYFQVKNNNFLLNCLHFCKLIVYNLFKAFNS